MANVRGLNDIENNNNNDRNMNQQSYRMLQNIPLLNQNSNINKQPKDENLCDLIKSMCCPQLKLNQFLVWMSLFQVIYFIISLIMSDKISGQFLQVGQQSLIDMGCKYPYLMRYHYQIQRFITPILLHSNFQHISFNIISQMIFGIQLECTIGSVNLLFIYLISGVGGNLLSSLVSDTLGVGASTAISGILITYLSWIILNWSYLEPVRQVRLQIMCFVFLVIFLNLMANLGNNNVDQYGHLGGYIVGFIAGFAFIDPFQMNITTQRTKLVARLTLILFFIIGFILFFTVRNPQY